MSLTKREVREVKWKLKRANQKQRFIFLDAMDVNPSADEIFKQLKDQDITCPQCGVIGEYRKHGTTSAGTQRYRCTACGRTFVEDYNRPTYGSRHAEAKWKAFFEDMIKGEPLSVLATRFGLSTRTAFDWRHKLLHALGKAQAPAKLSGRVWADETYLNTNKPGRGSAPGHGKTTVLTAQDCYNRLFVRNVSSGQGATTKKIKKAIGDVLDYEHSTLVSDDASNLISLSDEHGIEHETYKADEHDGELDLINWLHSHFKQWIKNFRGVATKYLQNYLNWYRYVKKKRHATPLKN